MSQDTKVPPKGSDWTRLLTDSDLVSHLGQLLQTYREVAPEQREAALLQAMREIKDVAIKGRAQEHETGGSNHVEDDKSVSEDRGVRETGGSSPNTVTVAIPLEVPPAPQTELHHPEPIKDTPPFEPDFTELPSDDRRRFQRVKCYVAVEIHIEGIYEPVWGNLVNVGRGGCLVETASAVPAGKALEIGLWVASGKIWVKGVILTGVATRSASFGVRVKFSESELSEKQHLREFLKFVESTARKSHSGNAYLTQLKS